MLSPGLSIYGTTKRAVRYLTEAVAKEIEGLPVIIGSLSPGMVPTDLLIYSSRGEDQEKWEKSRRIMNTLGDTVETVTPWLAEQALSNEQNGAKIEWLTRGKAMWRFMHPKYRKRTIVEDFEAQYISQGELEDRTIDETLDLGWELLQQVPRAEMKRVRDEYLKKYYDKTKAMKSKA